MAYSQLFATIHSIKQGSARPYAVRVADLYNPIPYVEESVLWILLFNRMLRRFRHPTLTVSDMYTPFVGREKELLSADRIHPNEEGYRVMAERLAACGPGPLIEATA
jgi:lysophospholipase L1-like esterase